MDNELLVSGHSALAEAKVLYGLVLRSTESVQELRELMAVPPKIEKVLRAYMKQSPEDAWWIERAIKFRQKVLAEFDRLVAEGAQAADLPKAEGTELEPFTDAMALAPA